MSSSEGTAGRVRLVVTADTPYTEIFVIDGKFQRVAKGLGELVVELPPGLYDVKFKAGSLSAQVPATLMPGQAQVQVAAPGTLEFSSAVPLLATRTSHEYHQAHATELSKQVHHVLGAGSEIFIFSRDLDDLGRTGPLDGLSLHGASGEMLADLSVIGIKGGGAGSGLFPSAGCTVRVDAGLYLLRMRGGEAGILVQTIVASKDWQTQVFLTRRAFGRGISGLHPDLANASVLMSRPGTRFDPSRDDLRLTELVRQGLANSRAVFSQRDLHEMLWAKFENPWLGIYGAHLMLLSAEPDLDLLREVTQNLYSLVGDHPDVRSLDIFLDLKRGNVRPFESYSTPPMLMSSWGIIQAATLSHRLIPSGSLAARISARLWGDGPWLIWASPFQREALQPQVMT